LLDYWEWHEPFLLLAEVLLLLNRPSHVVVQIHVVVFGARLLSQIKSLLEFRKSLKVLLRAKLRNTFGLHFRNSLLQILVWRFTERVDL
jgi:hypothetical protein